MYLLAVVLLLETGCAGPNFSGRHKVCYGKEVKLEHFHRRHFQGEMCYPWFFLGYEDYSTEKSAVRKLKKFKKRMKIVVVGAPWCEKTQDMLPHFYKAVEEAGIPRYRVKLIGIDKARRTLSGLQFPYEVREPPVVILFYKNKEIGRIDNMSVQPIEIQIANIYGGYAVEKQVK